MDSLPEQPPETAVFLPETEKQPTLYIKFQ